MKSYADTESNNYRRVLMPHGMEFPRGPQSGEMFYLDVDTIDKNDGKPWYSKGAYVFAGVFWEKLSDVPHRRTCGLIASQKIENELPVAFGNTPDIRLGYEIANAFIQPSKIRSTFSGAASLWFDCEEAGHVWIALFRDKKLVTFVPSTVTAKTVTMLSMTFFDSPNTREQALYSLRLYSSCNGNLYVNRCFRTPFDGISATALIIEENS